MSDPASNAGNEAGRHVVKDVVKDVVTDVVETRDRYAHLTTLDTRWMDNDAYGHVNNVVYYSFFDTAVNRWLIERGVLDVAASDTIGLVVETRCRYFRPITFPDRVTAGIRVAHLGRSSVHYEIGLFCNDDAEAAAAGHFVHVYVDRTTRKSTAIPAHVREALHTLRFPADISTGHRTPP